MIYLALGFFVGLLSHRIWRRIALRKAWQRLDYARNRYFSEFGDGIGIEGGPYEDVGTIERAVRQQGGWDGGWL